MSIGVHNKSGIKEAHSSRHRPENLRLFAEFFWRRLIYIVSLLMVFIVGFGTWELFSVLKDFGSGAGAWSATQTVPNFNKYQLRNTLERFKAREARFESLKISAPEFTDPPQ